MAGAVGTAIVQFLSFAGTLDRNVFGINGFWGLTDHGWAPPVPAWSLIFGAIVVTVGGAWLTIRADSRAERHPDLRSAESSFPATPAVSPADEHYRNDSEEGMTVRFPAWQVTTGAGRRPH